MAVPPSDGKESWMPEDNTTAAPRRHRTVGQRVADALARGAGSWPFILAQTVLWGAWITVNLTVPIRRWDPYPFILLNLALSFQAAYAAPIIMMSQNRQARKDRELAQQTFRLEQRVLRELAAIRADLDQARAVADRNAHRVAAGSEPHEADRDTTPGPH
jgi:uncharacterized membrane protein